MSVQVSYKKQFLVFFISLLILLLVIEGVVRIYEIQELPCQMVGKDAFNEIDKSIQEQICKDSRNIIYIEPDILRYAPNLHTDTLNINSFGFRGPEITQEKPNDVFRVFIVGGSTTFGSGSISDHHTIPGYLQEIFNQNGQNVEIINAGIASGYSYTEKYLIENDLIPFDPDLILLYTGGNDSHRPIIYPTVKIGDTGINIKDIRFWRTPFVISDLFIETTRYEKANVELDEEFIEKKISFWTDNMRDICEINSTRDIRTIITLHPILVTSQKNFSNDEKEYVEKKDFQSTPTVLKIYDGIGNNLKELGNSCDSTVDLRFIFKNMSEPIFFDESHINGRGNEIVAKQLFKIISPFVN